MNLDALRPREEFAAANGVARDTQTATISIAALEDSFFVQSLRNPDFQRERSNWTSQKIVDLILAFLDGEVIPAVIRWQSGQYVLVIDGAHRLSAILAWIYDDYGDKSGSITFLENRIRGNNLNLNLRLERTLRASPNRVC